MSLSQMVLSGIGLCAFINGICAWNAKTFARPDSALATSLRFSSKHSEVIMNNNLLLPAFAVAANATMAILLSNASANPRIRSPQRRPNNKRGLRLSRASLIWHMLKVTRRKTRPVLPAKESAPAPLVIWIHGGVSRLATSTPCHVDNSGPRLNP